MFYSLFHYYGLRYVLGIIIAVKPYHRRLQASAPASRSGPTLLFHRRFECTYVGRPRLFVGDVFSSNIG